MVKILIEVFTDLKFIIAFVFFISIITLLFYRPNKRKSKRKKKKFIKSKVEESQVKVVKDEPGKLYVPDSTYEILKNEGLMHKVGIWQRDL